MVNEATELLNIGKGLQQSIDAAEEISTAGKSALWSFAEGDEMRMMQMGLKRFTKMTPFNIKEERRKVAEKAIAENKYCF